MLEPRSIDSVSGITRALRSGQAGLPATRISVSPGQSQNRPLGERAASSARMAVSNAVRESPNRCGAAYDIEK